MVWLGEEKDAKKTHFSDLQDAFWRAIMSGKRSRGEGTITFDKRRKRVNSIRFLHKPKTIMGIYWYNI